MRTLPREPIPGRDRVAVRVPEHHGSPVYKPGQRIPDQPQHGQFTRDPQAHDVVTWGPLFYDLFREGALELVGLLLPGDCPRCADLPWRAEHQAVPGPGAVGGASAHHPDCPGCPEEPAAKPEKPAPAERPAPAPSPAPEASAPSTTTEER